MPPPPLCAPLAAARLQSNQRLCPLLRRDFQRWLHWRVTDAEIPGVLRSSSRPPLTLVKRQRGTPRPPPVAGHQEALEVPVPRPPPRVGHQVAAR